MDKVQLGPWVFIPSEYSISDGATHTELEPLLSKLLLYFVEQPGKIVSRQQLVDTIWQQSYVDDNAINRAISELRKALQHPQLPHSPIKTHHRKGYSFQLPLLSNTDVTNNNDVAPGQLTQAQTNTVSLQQSHRSAIWLGILSITLVFIIGMLWYRFAPEPTLTTQIQETSSRPQIVELDIINQQKITWYKGIQSRPLLSPDKQLLAYSHSQPDGAIRVLIRKLGTSAGTILQEVAIESSVAHNSVQNWQPQSRKLLIQVVSKDGNQCEYQQYDFNEYPQYQVTTLSQCSGFVLGVAQVSLDGQWLYYSKNSGGMHTSNALVAENLITGAVQTLQAAQSAGLGVTMLALSADGSKLAYILMPESNKPDIYLYDPASREHSLVVSLPFPMLFMGLEWSIDQTSLILPGADSIVQFNLADKSRTLFKLPAGVKVGELSLLSDNQAYISALTANSATEGGMQLVKVNQAFNDSERQIRFVTDVAGSSMALAVSPTDAKQYAFSANWTGGWQLWLNTNGQNIQLTELPNDPQLINHISWSGNGRYIAFTQQGNLYL